MQDGNSFHRTAMPAEEHLFITFDADAVSKAKAQIKAFIKEALRSHITEVISGEIIFLVHAVNAKEHKAA